MTYHDKSYKRFFSDPFMVRELLTGFIHEPWVETLDFTTLETVKSQFITDDFRQREDDIIWRVRSTEGWVYVYLLIEFQSRIDRFMAVRMLTYVSLLYQELIRQKQFTTAGKLPPVFPIVLYNGESRWHASVDIQDLIQTVGGGLSRYTPSMRYLVLDEGQWVAQSPGRQSQVNLVSALFQMEYSQSPEVLAELVGYLNDWSAEHPRLKKVFLGWLKRVLLPNRFPGVKLDQINDLDEVKDMLAERVKNWTEEWKLQGLQEGLEQGLEQGHERAQVQIAQKMLSQGLSDTLILELTGISAEALKILKQQP
ncbi:putative transposase [Nitrincola lacisaponensis]|uniref:Putative transposase n=1 Tax=Nitrincola lacisaponensis TaxID=267850 RepID=A0A063Y1Z8_9GAMM|nr:Rpn family recombination-promoting nuclease/putative transposase [Nitrincola lacisaponensis]KDE39709.1 putative transposase [Nitrincola lacisaponensis]